MTKYFVIRPGHGFLLARTPVRAIWGSDFGLAIKFDTAQAALDYLLPYSFASQCFVAYRLPSGDMKLGKIVVSGSRP